MNISICVDVLGYKELRARADVKELTYNADKLDAVLLHHNTLYELKCKKGFDEINRPILKISNPANGKYIYRKFRQGSNYGLGKHEIFLNNSDTKRLGVELPCRVQIKVASWWGTCMYLYYNPKQDIRFAVRSVLWAFLLAPAYSFVFDEVIKVIVKQLSQMFH
jgi:hypothetical protein